MSAVRSNEMTWRPAENFLVWAFAISLATHLIVGGGFLLGQRLGLWQKGLLPSWLKTTKQTLVDIQKNALNAQNPPAQQVVTLEFVEVDPSQMVKDAPKDAKYYSAMNAAAANPDARKETDKPKITGTQKDVPKTQTAPPSKQFPLQPSAERAPQNQEELKEARQKGGLKPGDLAMAKPSDNTDNGKAPDQKGDADSLTRKRPRTLVEAGKSVPLPGRTIDQDGGVKRRLAAPSFDVKGTPFGAYDAAFVSAVTYRWYSLIDDPKLTVNHPGKVILEFRLNYDGRITDMKMVKNEVGDLMGYLCQRAITDPAPYERWPSDMRKIIGSDSREITFTFNIY